MESILYQAMLNLERLLAQQQQQQQQQQQRQQPGDSSAARQQSESQSYPSQPEAVSTGFVQRPTAVSESSSTVESDNEQSIDETSTRRRSCTYRDYSNVLPPPDYRPPMDIQTMNFAEKLHHMLSNPDYTSIVEWRPHGRAFKVYVPQLFASTICPKYFNHNSYMRFRKDLDDHGFKRIPSGLDEGGHYHELFLRDRMFLCRHIHCQHHTRPRQFRPTRPSGLPARQSDTNNNNAAVVAPSVVVSQQTSPVVPRSVPQQWNPSSTSDAQLSQHILNLFASANGAAAPLTMYNSNNNTSTGDPNWRDSNHTAMGQEGRRDLYGNSSTAPSPTSTASAPAHPHEVYPSAASLNPDTLLSLIGR